MNNPILSAEPVRVGADEPDHWLFVLHGIYGAGRNWASVIRRLVRSRPDWGGLLVDLRQHGASQGFAPPHTIEAAAADLDALAARRVRPTAVIGHSFGGKVALAWAAGRPAGLRQVWLIDSTPEAKSPGGSAWEMLGVLEQIPGPFHGRDAAIHALEEHGVAPAVAQWMATNLEVRNGGLVWRFDLAAMRALIEDFFREDLWHVLATPPDGVDVHLVRALGASTVSDATAARIRELGKAIQLHEAEGGHWLNADNPDALVHLFSKHLP